MARDTRDVRNVRNVRNDHGDHDVLLLVELSRELLEL